MNITDIKGTVTLSNGVEMPYMGLGVFKTREGKEVENAVGWALETGYRHIDTAAAYGNEAGVGNALKSSGIRREEVFITTKVWNSEQGYEKTLKAFEGSLDKLQTDYADLYLVHWPVKDKYKETWKAMEDIYRSGRARAIGVSNFMREHLEDLLETAEVAPMVNQVECHPYLVQQELQDLCMKHNVRYEAWSPIMRGKVFEVELLRELAEKYGKNPAQIAIRWDLQKGIISIPKSVKKERIISNADVFDFELTNDEISKIDALDRGMRLGADPYNFNF